MGKEQLRFIPCPGSRDETATTGVPVLGYETKLFITDCSSLCMEQNRVRFASAVVLGFIVMVIFAVITVNILDLIPLAGPFFGGLAAGYYNGKDPLLPESSGPFFSGLAAGDRKTHLTDGSAGFLSGIFGAVVVGFDFFLNTGLVRAAGLQIPEIGGLVFLVMALIYFPVLAFIGGVIGGLLKRRASPAS